MITAGLPMSVVTDICAHSMALRVSAPGASIDARIRSRGFTEGPPRLGGAKLYVVRDVIYYALLPSRAEEDDEGRTKSS